jgi:tetratricopeptide (TPR) repeat protein
MDSFVAKNRITGFYIGMYGGNVVLYFTDTNCYPTNPNNKLTGNTKGLWLANGSLCEAGDADFLGYNSIFGNSTDVYCSINSALFAVGDYWGGGDLVNYNCDSSSYIWAPLPLDTDPWDNEQLVRPADNAALAITILKKVNKNDIISNLKQGFKLGKEGKIDEAITHYKNMVASDMACGPALTEIALLTRKNKRGDIKPYLTELMNSKINKKDEVIILLANLTLQDGDYTGAMKLYDKVIAEYPDNMSATFARVEKLFAVLHIEKNKEKAASLLSELQSMDITDPGLLSLLQSANMSIYGESSACEQRSKALSKVNTLSSLPKEYSLSNNYPNPFNPATSISYELPKDSYVKVVIYDILGKEIQTLVAEQQNSGKYTVNFNASNLPSGMYFYTISAGSYTATKKMLLLK